MLHLHTNDRWKQSCLKKIVSVFVSWGYGKKTFVFMCVSTALYFELLTYNSSFGGIKKPLLLSLGSFGTTIMGPESFQIHIRTY